MYYINEELRTYIQANLGLTASSLRITNQRTLDVPIKGPTKLAVVVLRYLRLKNMKPLIVPMVLFCVGVEVSGASWLYGGDVAS